MAPSAWHGEHPALFSQHIHGLLRLNTVVLAIHLLKHVYDPNKISKKERKKNLTKAHGE